LSGRAAYRATLWRPGPIKARDGRA